MRHEASLVFEDVLSSGARLRVRVTGRSMAPFLRGGEVAVIEAVSFDRLRIGDIVFYRADDNGLVLHRLVLKWRRPDGTGMIRTRGDGLRACDPAVVSERILGRVVLVEDGTGPKSLDTTWMKVLGYLRAIKGLGVSFFLGAASRILKLL